MRTHKYLVPTTPELRNILLSDEVQNRINSTGIAVCYMASFEPNTKIPIGKITEIANDGIDSLMVKVEYLEHSKNIYSDLDATIIEPSVIGVLEIRQLDCFVVMDAEWTAYNRYQTKTISYDSSYSGRFRGKLVYNQLKEQAESHYLGMTVFSCTGDNKIDVAGTVKHINHLTFDESTDIATCVFELCLNPNVELPEAPRVELDDAVKIGQLRSIRIVSK